MRGTELGGMPAWRVGGLNWKACSYSAGAPALRQGLGPWNAGRFSMWILWDLAFETLSLYSVAAFGRAAVGQGKNRTGDRTPGVKRQELPEEKRALWGSVPPAFGEVWHSVCACSH